MKPSDFYNYFSFIFSSFSSFVNFFSVKLDYFFRLFKLFYLKFFNRLKREIKRKTGYNWYDLMDGLFLASFILIFFKFSYRLILLSNPIWYINIIVYFLSFFMHLKFPIILETINEYYVFLTKWLLGKGYWGDKSGYERKSKDIIIEHFKSAEEINEYWYLNGFEEFVVIDIYKGSLFNKYCQNIFIAFILLRLWIFKHPYLFIISNFFFTYFLLFNKYLILTSIISIIILISRITIFITDFNKPQLYKVIDYFENIEKDDYIIPNWENAKTIGFIILRSYPMRDCIKEHKERNYSNKNLNKLDLLYCCGVFFFHEKYMQINSLFLTLTHENMKCYSRKLRCLDDNREYGEFDKIIKLAKYKKLKDYFNIYLNLSMFGVMRKSKEGNKLLNITLTNNQEKSTTRMFGNNEEKVKEKGIKKENKVFYQSIPKPKGQNQFADIEKPGKNRYKPPFLQEHLKVYYIDSKAQNHPTNYRFNDEQKSIEVITESTIRNKEYPFLLKLAFQSNSRYSLLQSSQTIVFEDIKEYFQIKEILEQTENLEVMEVDRDWTISRQTNNLDRTYALLPKSVQKEKDFQLLPSDLIIPDTIIFINNLWMDITAERRLAEEGIKQTIRYHSIMAENNLLSKYQRDLQADRIIGIKAFTPDISHLSYNQANYHEAEKKIINFVEINDRLPRIAKLRAIDEMEMRISNQLEVTKERAGQHIYSRKQAKKELREYGIRQTEKNDDF